MLNKRGYHIRELITRRRSLRAMVPNGLHGDFSGSNRMRDVITQVRDVVWISPDTITRVGSAVVVIIAVSATFGSQSYLTMTVERAVAVAVPVECCYWCCCCCCRCCSGQPTSGPGPIQTRGRLPLNEARVLVKSVAVDLPSRSVTVIVVHRLL